MISVGAAFFGASWCANRFVTPVSRWLEPLLRESIRQKLSGQDGADAGELLSAFAFDTHSLEKILEDVAQRVKETGESVFSAVTESVSHSIAYGIVYAAAFIAILLVVWLLLKPLDLAGKLPVVRTVNAWGGALLGLVWAVLLLFVLAFWKKATCLNVLTLLFELGAVFFLVQSILTVFPEGQSNWYLPLALGLNCVALFLNAAQRKNNKRKYEK